MDLRVVVLSADQALGELIRAQVDNLGCRCAVVETYDLASAAALDWAEAAIVDLAGDGLDDLNRLRVEAPLLRVLAVASDPQQADDARSAGAHSVLVEPFPIGELVEAVRRLDRASHAGVVDLRTGQTAAAPVVDDAPWWVTR